MQQELLGVPMEPSILLARGNFRALSCYSWDYSKPNEPWKRRVNRTRQRVVDFSIENILEPASCFSPESNSRGMPISNAVEFEQMNVNIWNIFWTADERSNTCRRKILTVVRNLSSCEKKAWKKFEQQVLINISRAIFNADGNFFHSFQNQSFWIQRRTWYLQPRPLLSH